MTKFTGLQKYAIELLIGKRVTEYGHVLDSVWRYCAVLQESEGYFSSTEKQQIQKIFTLLQQVASGDATVADTLAEKVSALTAILDKHKRSEEELKKEKFRMIFDEYSVPRGWASLLIDIQANVATEMQHEQEFIALHPVQAIIFKQIANDTFEDDMNILIHRDQKIAMALREVLHQTLFDENKQSNHLITLAISDVQNYLNTCIRGDYPITAYDARIMQQRFTELSQSIEKAITENNLLVNVPLYAHMIMQPVTSSTPPPLSYETFTPVFTRSGLPRPRPSTLESFYDYKSRSELTNKM